MKTNKLIKFTYLLLTALAMGQTLHADNFGSGVNAFTIDFVNVGNAGNANDRALDDTDNTPGNPNDDEYASPFGGVAYGFRMGTYEVSEDMITKANAEGGLGITKDTRGVDKPATSVSWNEAARFVNWMNTSRGFSAAYKFTLQPGGIGYNANANISLWQIGDAGYDASNPYRDSRAIYFLPSENEWYKAAFYSGSGTTYYDYATESNTIPTPVSNGASGAVYNGQSGPADVDNAGGSSFYGTEAQNGNVWEWNESAFDAPNDSSSEFRAFRGSGWVNIEGNLRSSIRGDSNPTFEFSDTGFRVASVPEPSTVSLLGFGGSALFLQLRRRRKLS